MENLFSKTDLEDFQRHLIRLFTSQQEREQFLQSTETEYASFHTIQLLPKKPVIVYADLLKATADSVMSSIFPAIRSCFSEHEWTNLLEHYLSTYPTSHYRLNAMAQNFSRYLAQFSPEKPWLTEIADYEYQELVVEESNAEQSISDSFTPLRSQTEIITLCPMINQTLCHRRYEYDVVESVNSMLHNRQTIMTPLPQKTIVVLFRDPQTNICRQLKLGKLAESVLLAAQEEVLSYAHILRKCLTNEASANLEERISDLLVIVNDFHEANLFTGNFKYVSSES